MVRTIADWHREYFPLVFRRCRHMLRHNAYDPEDAAQDVFVNLLGYAGKDLQNIDNAEGLLWTIATNVCLNRLKAKKWKPGEDFSQNAEENYPAAGDDFKNIDEKLFLQNILDDEPEDVRSLYYFYYCDGMGLEEIAMTTGKSKSWAGKTLAAFREKVKKELKENVNE